MTDNVYKITEIVGSSANGIEDAISNAVSKASKTLRELRWLLTACLATGRAAGDGAARFLMRS